LRFGFREIPLPFEDKKLGPDGEAPEAGAEPANPTGLVELPPKGGLWYNGD
jgi:hypothetical protein